MTTAYQSCLRSTLIAWFCLCWGGSTLEPLSGSDHADPIIVRFLGRADSNLTGLFAFETRNKLVIALCARPGLAEKFVDLKPLTFDVHIDFDSKIAFADKKSNDEGRTFRYGGWVKSPEKISEDITFRFSFAQLDSNPFQKVKFGDGIGLEPEIISHFALDPNIVDFAGIQQSTRSWVGIRDDPFILQGFSSTNVVAMVLEIPLKHFGRNRNLLVWGTSSRYGKQIDHVGRSLRTMLPRFEFLNQLHPSKHVAAIKQRHETPGLMQDILRFGAGPIFGIRHYDFEPDVLIFSQARWHQELKRLKLKPWEVRPNDPVVGFPNGRRLPDDVAALMCERGDCLLFEVSTASAHADEVPRPTRNGKPFSNSFPYLAEPNENPLPEEQPQLRVQTMVILLGIGLAILLFILFPYWLWWKTKKNLRRAQREIAILKST